MKRLPAALATSALAFSVAPVLPAAAAAFPFCTESGSLPAIPSSEGVRQTGPHHGDPSGRYQVASTLSDDRQNRMGAWIWRNGVGSRLIPLTSGYVEVTDVNVRGDSVGSAYGGDVPQHGWRIRDGRRTELPQPPGAEASQPVAVNSSGEVAGYTSEAAVVWGPDDAVRVLPFPAGFNRAQAADIDEDGTVVGTASRVEGGMPVETRPVAWSPTGEVRLLPDGSLGGQATAVRNGIAVGTDGTKPVSWDLSTDTVTSLSDHRGTALAINAGGDVLASIEDEEVETPALQFIRSGQAPRGVDRSSTTGVLTDTARVFAGLSYYACG